MQNSNHKYHVLLYSLLHWNDTNTEHSEQFKRAIWKQNTLQWSTICTFKTLTSAAKDILCEYTPAILISKLFWVFEFAKAVPYRDILCTWLVIQGDSSLQNLSVSASFRLCQLILSMDALVGSFSSVTTESVFIGWSNPKIKTPNQLFWNQWI